MNFLNNPNMPQHLKAFFQKQVEKAREAPIPNPDPGQKKKKHTGYIANADSDDDQEEYSLEYIIRKKPKTKFVKEYMRQYVNKCFAEDSD